MKFKVEKIKQAEKEYNSLTSSQKELLDEDYAKVENEGLERVSTKKIEKNIYEIRTSLVIYLSRWRNNHCCYNICKDDK